MAEHKKPFPDNKHETRLVTESRPAGIAASMYREEAGSSIDMVEIVGEKPRVVRVSQAAYNGLVRDGTEFMLEDHAIVVFNDPPVPPNVSGPWHVIGTVPVPAGMAYDLTELSFSIIAPLEIAGFIDTYHAVDDNATFAIYMMRVCIQGVMPWAAYSLVGVPVTRFQGMIVGLNKPWLSAFGDCPVHLVATEGQSMTFEACQVVAGDPTLLFEEGVFFAKPRGRWIPIQHYNRIVHANRLE